jgi:hypothetical protein
MLRICLYSISLWNSEAHIPQGKRNGAATQRLPDNSRTQRQSSEGFASDDCLGRRSHFISRAENV